MVSEPTCQSRRYSGADWLSCVRTYLPGTVLSVAGFLSDVRTYLPGTVLQWCRLGADCLSGVRTYLPGIVLQWCRLFKQCHKLPARHYGAVVQDISVVAEPTCRALCYSVASCLNKFWRLHAGHCVTEMQTV